MFLSLYCAFHVHVHRPRFWSRDKTQTWQLVAFFPRFPLQLICQAMNLEMIPFPYPEPNPNEAGHLIHGSWLCWRIPLKDRDLCLEEPGGCTHQMMASLWVKPWVCLNYFCFWFFYRITCQSKTYSAMKKNSLAFWTHWYIGKTNQSQYSPYFKHFISEW